MADDNSDELQQKLIALAKKLAGQEELRKDVANWLANECGLPHVVCSAAINSVFRMGELLVGHAGQAARSRLTERLLRIPSIRKLVEALGRLDVQAAARQGIEQQMRTLIDDAKLPETAALELIQAQFLISQFAALDETLAQLFAQTQDLHGQLQAWFANKKFLRADLLHLPRHVATPGILANLRYTSGLHPFIGREQELELLGDFLAAPDSPFRWMLMTAPGGYGKSRLAYEVCLDPSRLNTSQEWIAGFLRMEDVKAFVEHMGNGGVNTPGALLIVVDYAAQQPRRVADLLGQLAGHAGSFTHPVRLQGTAAAGLSDDDLAQRV